MARRRRAPSASTNAPVRSAKREGRSSPPVRTAARSIFATDDASLLDVVDNVLNKGVVLTGDITIGVARVELIYARVSLLLCAADRVLPTEDTDHLAPRSRRQGNRDS